MLHNTVASLHHAFHFSTLCAYWKSLNSGTKVAKRPVLLLPGALVTLHDGVARMVTKVNPGRISSNGFLAKLLLLRLLPLTSFLLRHGLDFNYKQAVTRYPTCFLKGAAGYARRSKELEFFERHNSKQACGYFSYHRPIAFVSCTIANYMRG